MEILSDSELLLASERLVNTSRKFNEFYLLHKDIIDQYRELEKEKNDASSALIFAKSRHQKDLEDSPF